jgi:phage head maturation protease
LILRGDISRYNSVGFNRVMRHDPLEWRHREAYVEFIHYVERLYEASTTVTHGHFDETRPDAHDR